MPERKPKRKTVPINTQIDPTVADAMRQFAESRGETLRLVLEQAIKRHIANPPPILEIPPLPPVSFADDSRRRKTSAKE